MTYFRLVEQQLIDDVYMRVVRQRLASEATQPKVDRTLSTESVLFLLQHLAKQLLEIDIIRSGFCRSSYGGLLRRTSSSLVQ